MARSAAGWRGPTRAGCCGGETDLLCRRAPGSQSCCRAVSALLARCLHCSPAICQPNLPEPLPPVPALCTPAFRCTSPFAHSVRSPLISALIICTGMLGITLMRTHFEQSHPTIAPICGWHAPQGIGSVGFVSAPCRRRLRLSGASAGPSAVKNGAFGAPGLLPATWRLPRP